MTKIVYIRATSRQQQELQQQNTSTTSLSQSTMINTTTTTTTTSSTISSKPRMNQHHMMTPSIPSSMIMSRPSFPNPNMNRIGGQQQPNNHRVVMAPTTRFNTNPNILLFDQINQNGGRISKPLIEKRRRARINQCLSQLKTIVVDSAGQMTQNNKCKLEKADILELTVNYVKKLHQEYHQKQLPVSSEMANDLQYLAGYRECIRQLNEFLNTVPTIADEHKQLLKEHLEQCLDALMHPCTSNTNTNNVGQFVNLPPSPAPSSNSSSSGGCGGSSSSSNSNSPRDDHLVESPNMIEEISSEIISHHHGKKRTYGQSFSDNEDEDEEESMENDLDENEFYPPEHHQSSPGDMHPLNLKVSRHNHHHDHNHLIGGMMDDDVWRPW